MKAGILTFIFILSGATAFAMVHGGPAVEDLVGKSTLICNGVVESITDTDTGKNVDSSDTGTFTAKIKVLHVFKGKAGAEVEFRYLNDEAIPGWAIQVKLKKGARYRFFLKNGPTPDYFISALDKKQVHDGFDDGFAVAPLAPKEPDDSSYITHAEAFKIIQKWLKDHHPELPRAVETTDPDFAYVAINILGTSGDPWTAEITTVDEKGGMPKERQLVVESDRTVNDKDWDKHP